MKLLEVYIEKLKTTIPYRIGSNAQDNFDIIDDSEPQDLWFHLNNDSSSHIVASVPEGLKRKDRMYIIRQGALLCKNNHNKSKKEKNVEVVFTAIKNISKTETVGMVELAERSIITI